MRLNHASENASSAIYVISKSNLALNLAYTRIFNVKNNKSVCSLNVSEQY